MEREKKIRPPKDWLFAHPDSKFATPQIRRFVRYGASPRGAQTLVLAGKALAFMENRFNSAVFFRPMRAG